MRVHPGWRHLFPSLLPPDRAREILRSVPLELALDEDRATGVTLVHTRTSDAARHPGMLDCLLGARARLLAEELVDEVTAAPL